MFPCLSVNNLAYRFARNAVFIGQSLLCFSLTASSSNVDDLRCSQRRSLFANGCTALRAHVQNIISIGSNKQVIGIHARRIVAFVQYVKSSRNLAIGYFIRQSMRQNIFGAGNTNNSVTGCVGSARPDHAAIRIRFTYILTKTFLHGSPSPAVATFERTKSPSARIVWSWKNLEFTVADFADARQSSNFASSHRLDLSNKRQCVVRAGQRLQPLACSHIVPDIKFLASML